MSTDATDYVYAMTLTTDETLRKQLRAKLEEYQSRPESMDRTCKVAVLERLLADGMVDLDQLWLELIKKHEIIAPKVLANAFSVIQGYNGKQGGHERGTGLPPVP
jgi:hypothetical protein